VLRYFLWEWSRVRSEVEWSLRGSKTAEPAEGEAGTEVDMIAGLEKSSIVGRDTPKLVCPMAGRWYL
jgi:hypothetical protein